MHAEASRVSNDPARNGIQWAETPGLADAAMADQQNIAPAAQPTGAGPTRCGPPGTDRTEAMLHVFAHYADDARTGLPNGSAGRPATKAEAVAQSQARPTLPFEQAPKQGAIKDQKSGPAKHADSKGKSKSSKRTKRGTQTSLPRYVMAAFPKEDLTGVSVYLNSEEAAAQGVDGFATSNEIHVAPGANEKKTLLHETAHVVQFRNGKLRVGKGRKPNSRENNERIALQVEQGNIIPAHALGAAAPGEVRFKNKTQESDGSEKGIPKVTFNGVEFKSIEGEFVGELAKAEWHKMYLFDKDVWWRLPIFPAAGLYVRASAYLEPKAGLSWKGSYKYERGRNGEAGKFQVGAALEGELSAGITGALQGGAGINLVLQKGGVGLEAALTAQAYAKYGKQINFWIDTHGNVGLDLVPFELDFGAVVKGALRAVVWTEGFFYNKKKSWNLAEATIATIAQYKTQISVSFNTKDKIKPTIGPVQSGAFVWGEAPSLSE